MSIKRILGILRQELYITLRSLETINDIFIFSLIQLFLFGIISLFLIGNKNPTTAYYLLIGMLLWEIIRIIQYSISVGCLWNIWSRNLSNMFITPLTPKEYLVGFTLSGILKALIVFVAAGIIARLLFGFNIFGLGIFNLLLDGLNLGFFAFSLGIIIMGLIFRYGTRIQAIAWSIVPILQPLSAAFYPLKVMPYPLQIFASILPSTFVFEAARANLMDISIQWAYQGIAFFENIVYLVIAIWIFGKLFKASKDTGQFARNES
ncbi:MAG TPA: ABC transporter permease [Patescibacteria group bacterium]